MTLSIGFTGTRHGMTPTQLDAVRQLIADLAPVTTFSAHHGDCIGADAQFHDLCRAIDRAYIIVHPGPVIDGLQAGCVGDDRRAPARHMARNRSIVAESTVMIATPFEADEQPRGGTWATIGMARRAGKPLALAHRSGLVTKERWP